MHDVLRLLAGTWAQRALWLLVAIALIGSMVPTAGHWGASSGLQSALGPGELLTVVLAMAGIMAIAARREGVTHVRLRKSLTQCETLFREMHHRTKNNLQLVSSLVALQWRNDPDPVNRERAKVTLNRIALVAEAHQQLYLAGRQTRVNCSDYLKTICDGLVVDRSQMTIAFDCPAVFVPLSQAVPLGLIVNELVTNAIKHVAPAGKMATVSVTCHQPAPGTLRVSVADNGPGLAPGAIGRGLGLTLVESLVGQLHGEFRIDGHDGTRAELTVAIQEVGEEYESTTPPADRAAMI